MMRQQIKEYKSCIKLYKEWEGRSLDIQDQVIEFRNKANEILCSLFEEFLIKKVFKKEGIISMYGMLRDKFKLSFENIKLPETLHKLLDAHNVSFDSFQEHYSLVIRRTEYPTKENYNMYDIEIEQFPYNAKENTIFDLIDKYNIKISVNEINFKIDTLKEVIKKLESYNAK